MVLSPDCLENLKKDLLDDLEKASAQPHHATAIREASDIINILRYFEDSPKVEDSHEAAPSKPKPHTDDICYITLVEDELEDADKYWGFYTQTKDDLWRQLSKQELSHASAILNRFAEMSKMKEDMATVQDLKARYTIMERVIK